MTSRSDFGDPPPVAAFRHRDARAGYEVVWFDISRPGMVRVEGVTAAVEERQPFVVEYSIELEADWRTRRARVVGRSLAGPTERVFESDGKGGWSIDGKIAPAFADCVDLDLESSAVTNAFPVRRLALQPSEAADAPAVYVRALGLEVERLEQRYARLRSDSVRFDYTAPQFDFRCELEYDRSGLLIDYPGLARRVAL